VRRSLFGFVLVLATVAPPVAAADDTPSLTMTVPATIIRGQSGPEELKGVVPDGGSLSWIIRPAHFGPCAATEFDDTNNRLGSDESSFYGDGSKYNLPGGAFDVTATARAKNYLAGGDYFMCGWVSDSSRNTVATAQVATAIVRPRLTLKVTPPAAPRKGLRGTFVASGHVDTGAYITVAIIPSKVVVCNDSETACHYKRVRACPRTSEALTNFESTTSTAFGYPFPGSEGSDQRTVHGDFRLHRALRAATTGTFFLCGYAEEKTADTPSDGDVTTTSFTTFRVR